MLFKYGSSIAFLDVANEDRYSGQLLKISIEKMYSFDWCCIPVNFEALIISWKGKQIKGARWLFVRAKFAEKYTIAAWFDKNAYLVIGFAEGWKS